MAKPYANYEGLIGLLQEVKKAMNTVNAVRTLATDVQRTAPEDQQDDLANAISGIFEAADELYSAFDALDELAHENAPDRTPD